MRFNKCCLSLLFLSISVFLLIFAKFYEIKFSDTYGAKNPAMESDVILSDDPKNIMWFLQISDLHISKFKDPSRTSDFRKFCSEVVSVVNPMFVIASGDLTDAKDAILGSEQYPEEWKAYYQTLTETKVMNNTKWLDLRGNHDNFNVQYLYHSTDLFRNFSSQGRYHKRSYITNIKVDESNFDIVALDASVEPGTKRPYNFIGMINQEELSTVEQMVKSSNANYIIWFAHYPTSTILTPPGYMHIRKFIGQFDKSILFVAGHLHTLGRMVNRMYALQPEGFLELELADFMRTRRFRLAAIDNGLLSILDVPLNTYPLAIITNPKNMLFNNPFKENIKLQAKSTHIRILAFSKSAIVICKVKIDEEIWKMCEKKKENFFVVPWTPSKYANGKHEITLYVEDADGRSFTNQQYFALDGTKISFDFLAEFVLMSDLTTVFQISYIIVLCVCILPLVVFKIWQILLKFKIVQRPKIHSLYWKKFVQKYLILCSVNRIYYGLVIMFVWTTIGPWSFHEILDGYTGFVFLWGTFVKGHFVPGTLSYWYGIHQLLWFQLPLMIILAGVVKKSYKHFLIGSKPEESFLHVAKSNLSFVALVFAESFLALFYLIQNGFFSFLIAPLRVWSLIFSIFLFYQAYFKISDSCFQSSARIFAIEDEPKQS